MIPTSIPGSVYSPLEAERMARREYQNPSVLERDSATGKEWYIRYRIKVLTMDKGKFTVKRVEKHYNLGLCAKVTKHQAERERDRIMREVNAQVYTVQSQVPWSEFVKIYDENHVGSLAEPSRDTYRRHLINHINPFFEKMQLGKIGPLELEQFFRMLEKGGMARSTRNCIRGILGGAFKCARKWRFLDGVSPMSDINIGGGPDNVRETKVPDVGDIGKLMDLCDGDIPFLIEFLASTGLRISEASGLCASELDFETEMIHVQRRRYKGELGETKSKAGDRFIPMGDLVEKLARQTAGKFGADPLFTYRDQPIVGSAVLSHYVTPRMEKLGIKFPGFGWHTFRRLHLSTMNQRGLGLFDLMRQAGHVDPKTTRRYIADDASRRTEMARAPFLVRKKKA
jgi:integrase